ncbi:FKBP-type peptidyl-prolyl cis-trans isomerase [bacterium]|nr:FKBP-type peptidyl-prolyl cis-trans isomerase [bacterium]
MKNITKYILTATTFLSTSFLAAEEAKEVAEKPKTNHEQICKTNLIAAESFLTANAKESGVKTLVENRLQMRQIQTGNGKACSSTDTVVVQYKGTLLDGSVFDQSKTNASFPLNAVVKGFKEGIVGMQVGETRILYIHPEFAYGDKKGMPFPPNSLLIFEVKLVDLK